ncbi:MAG: MFS transporter [Aggregatilineales bacterium]
MAKSMSASPAHNASDTTSIQRVILASSVGTMIEWYDFYLFGSLTFVLAPKFFPTQNTDPTISVIAWLALYATGFLVRPFGALFFGRIGDLIGRKYTFLVTLTIMGLSTAAIGLMPTYASIGILAPLGLLILRLLEGLALGGEYGGAATYVAEYSPDDKRGYYTSFIQITATAGLLLSLVVILVLRNVLDPGLKAGAFEDWGWRIAFLISAILVAISLYIRLSLRESPMYAKIKQEGKTSKNPLRESFGNPYNRRMVLLALFGATAGQGVIWYTGQFYSSTFMQGILKVDFNTANLVVAAALVCGSPFFVVMGILSDRIGRKKLIMAGCLLAAICYVPIYMAMKSVGPYLTPLTAKVGDAATNPSYSPLMLAVLIFIQVLFVTMVYGPIAAFLVELFPTKIRYTSMSVPYHFGNGWFGGLIPVLATALVAAFAPNQNGPSVLGDNYIYIGLAFPIVVALITFVVGTTKLPETRGVDLAAEGDNMEAAQAARAPGR